MPRRRNLAATAAGWSARHRWTAVIGWLLFVVLAVVVGNASGPRELTDADYGVGESGRADRILEDAGIKDPAGEMVLISSDRLAADDPAFRAVVGDVVARVDATGVITALRSPYDSGAVAEDRHSVLVQFDITGDPDTATDRVQPVIDAVKAAAAAHPEVGIEQFGDASSEKWFDDTIGEDFKRAEWTAVPLALGILLIAFGALVAALLPVALALTAFIAAGGLLALVSNLMPKDETSMSVMLLIGLAVGVDYCLFYLRREREERAKGHDARRALEIAAATSGRSVLISGVTVIIAMAGMLVSGLTQFESMGMATILVVLTAVIGSVTVLPALLSLLGERVEAGKVPGLGRMRRPSEDGGRVWNVVLRAVLRRPVAWAVLSAGLLAALAVPAFGMKTSLLSMDKELPDDLAIVRTYQHIQEDFPGGPSPAHVIVKAKDIDDPALTAAVEDLRRRALATGEMHEPIEVTRHDAQNILEIAVPLAGDGGDKVSEHALKTLRDDVIPATLGTVDGVDAPVTGSTAGSKDFNDALAGATLPVFAFVLVFAFLLMLVSFRSLAVAVTAIVLNLLSVGAAYGVLALVFQHGVGDSLVGTEAPGAIISWLPMFLFVVLFGLSMDYHVFVVSRIREAHDRGMSTRDAVSYGIRTTAGVVTSAAVIMVAVFAVFGTLSLQQMKQMGVGLAVAVLLDATIIRAVLLPAVMSLLGERNWYLPRWLGWLPQMDHGDQDAGPATGRHREPALAGAAYSAGHEPVSTSARIPRPPLG